MAVPGTLTDASPASKALFCLLVGVFVAGLAIAVTDKLERVGQPDAGFLTNRAFVYPTRDDAADAGLRWGGRLVELNGEAVRAGGQRFQDLPITTRLENGAINRLKIEQPGGERIEVAIEVRPWRAADALYTQGAIDVIGLLLAALGIATFLLRPWGHESWALLALTCLSGGLLETLYVPRSADMLLPNLYFAATLGFVCVAPAHVALALPRVHAWLPRPRTLAILYGFGALISISNVATVLTLSPALSAIARPLSLGTQLLAILVLVGRSAVLAVRANEALLRQRARILLLGTLVGFVPLTVALFLQVGLEVLSLDLRPLYWLLGLFVFAVARITLRVQLLNARVAVRRGVAYAAASLGLTGAAVWLSAISPWAVALLLFPMLYAWPRFSLRLEARLYPKRSQLQALMRVIGREFAQQGDAQGVLKVLAQAAQRVVDSRSAVATLFPGTVEDRGRVACYGEVEVPDDADLGDFALFRIMRVTRKELTRAAAAVEPQYATVRDELIDEFDRLKAVLAVPMIDEREQMVGALMLGPREGGEPYEEFETDAAVGLAQQAYESIERTQVLLRLRERERDFSDLKRFFPAPVIDRVMARGGGLGLERRRCPVSVVFADLRGFTAFSDAVEPEEVTETLNEFHTAMGEHVSAWEGTLERFTGEGFLVFFNDPIEQPDHVERAVRMALAMRETALPLRAAWQRKGYAIDLGLGVDTGYATCGFIGYEGRRDYAVIGNVTTLAARLSGTARGGEILVSARARAELGDTFATEPAGTLELEGWSEAQAAYRLA